MIKPIAIFFVDIFSSCPSRDGLEFPLDRRIAWPLADFLSIVTQNRNETGGGLFYRKLRIEGLIYSW